MTSVRETLNAAADLLEPEGRWTQEDYALDSEGGSVDPTDERAQCFCALGAIRHAGGFSDDVNAAAQELGTFVGALVCDWNDAPNRTQAEVVQTLRDAAKAAGGPA